MKYREIKARVALRSNALAREEARLRIALPWQEDTYERRVACFRGEYLKAFAMQRKWLMLSGMRHRLHLAKRDRGLMTNALPASKLAAQLALSHKIAGITRLMQVLERKMV